MGIYRVAQICLNGHCITYRADTSPELKSNFCPQCGARTITHCPSCNSPIRGEYDVPSVFVLGGKYTPPRYCHNCGNPYPWTQAAFDEIDMLARDDGNVSGAEVERLQRVLPDLITDTPRTRAAAKFFIDILRKSGEMLKDAMLDFAAKFATEMVKSYLPK